MANFTEMSSTRVRIAVNRVGGKKKAIYAVFAQRGWAATRECATVIVSHAETSPGFDADANPGCDALRRSQIVSAFDEYQHRPGSARGRVYVGTYLLAVLSSIQQDFPRVWLFLAPPGKQIILWGK